MFEGRSGEEGGRGGSEEREEGRPNHGGPVGHVQALDVSPSQ